MEGLQSGKTYTIRVYARDGAGNLSSSSNVVTVTLPGEIAAPTKPVVEEVDVGPTHVKVITLNSRTKTFTCSAVLVPTGCTPLRPDTTYEVTVRARDVDGNNTLSDPLLVRTAPAPDDRVPPSPPANLTAEDDGGFVIVDWDASTDDLEAPSLIRYDVYVNGVLRAVVVGQTIAAEVDGDSGLNQIEVIAVDTAGNESEPSVTELIF